MVNLHRRRCLVVGAGKVAADKISGLLAYGAAVEVVSPRAIASIERLARDGKLVWHCRKFSPQDVSGACLVISATNSRAVNRAVFRACKAQGVLCNAVDDPPNCDFFYPAVVRRGSLQIAISTNGSSPALAARLRRELEQQFGPEWEAWVEHVGRIRRRLLAGKMPPDARRAKLMETAGPEAFRAFLRSRRHKAGTRKRTKS